MSFSLSVKMWVCVRVWVLVQVFGVGCFDGICISRRRCHECFLFMCISSRLTLPSWSKRLLCRISFPITAFFCFAFWPLPPFFVDGWRGGGGVEEFTVPPASSYGFDGSLDLQPLTAAFPSHCIPY